MNSKNFRSLCEAYGQVHQPNMIDFEDWVDELIDEGYDLSDYSWDELYEVFCEATSPGTTAPKPTQPPTDMTTPPTTQTSPNQILARRGGVPGTMIKGDPNSWRAKNWNNTETSRYSSQKAKTPPPSLSVGGRRSNSELEGKTFPTRTSEGGTKYEVRTPTSAEMRAARGAGGGEAGIEAAVARSSNLMGGPKQRPPGRGIPFYGNPILPTNQPPNPTSVSTLNRAIGSSKPGSNFRTASYNYNLHPEIIDDVSTLYQSIYEGKKKVDQDVDGDNDFADVMIARMVASGVPRDEAIRRVRSKEYNLKNEDINEAAPAIAAVAARLAPMASRLRPVASKMKPGVKRGLKVGADLLGSITPSKDKEAKNQNDGGQTNTSNKGEDFSNTIKKGLSSMYKMGENYDYIISYLLDEGYDLSDYTWDELYEICEETLKDKEEREAEIARRRARVKELQSQGRVMTSSRRASATAKQRREANKAEALEKAAQAVINSVTGTPGRRSESPMGSTLPPEKEKAPEATRRLPRNLRKDNLGSAADRVLKSLRNEDYDVLALYLIDEGYVDSLGAAEIILENMSDEWLDELLDEGRIEQLKWKYTQRYGKPEDRDTLRQHVARKKYEDAAKRHQSGYGPSPNVGKSGKLTKGQMMYKAHRSAQSMRGQR